VFELVFFAFVLELGNSGALFFRDVEAFETNLGSEAVVEVFLHI